MQHADTLHAMKNAQLRVARFDPPRAEGAPWADLVVGPNRDGSATLEVFAHLAPRAKDVWIFHIMPFRRSTIERARNVVREQESLEMSITRTDPPIGSPASDEEQRAYSAWADKIEAGEYEPASEGKVFQGATATQNATELLEALNGAETLAKAVGRVRPGPEGKAGVDPSVKRQVRLPQELDARLAERATLRHVELSVIMRAAIDSYLRQLAGTVAE